MAETDFVTQREFDRVVRSLEGSIRDGQSRVDGELRRLTDAIRDSKLAAPAQQQPSQEMLSIAAAIHRGVETMTTPRRGNFQGIAFGALLPVLLWLAWKAFA